MTPSKSTTPWRRSAAGALVALGGVGVLTLLMLPDRDHLSLATPALVLVVPVVAGVAVGGFGAGVVAVAGGFVVYDVAFVPPYGSFVVGATQDWIALAVYVVVMLVVARVVAFLQQVRAEANTREEQTRRLYLFSDLLIGDRPLPELLDVVCHTIETAFSLSGVAVLLPDGDELRVGATAGEPLSDEVRHRLAHGHGRPQPVRSVDADGITRVVLMATGRPLGLLALSRARIGAHGWELLHTYANQVALAIERAQLREQALRTELLEQADTWRDALVGAVSHDLRTPLATVKTAVSTLRRCSDTLSKADREELLELIEVQSDRLSRLVTNLLDMTRLEAGGLQLRLEVGPVVDVVEEAIASLDLEGRVVADLPAELPLVEVDQALMVRVLANLLENAARYSPENEAVEVSARAGGVAVLVAVGDRGPGVALQERGQVFRMLNRVSGAGRAGLGLTIAKAFVEAHGGQIWVEDRQGGGARFVFTMPRADVPSNVS